MRLLIKNSVAAFCLLILAACQTPAMQPLNISNDPQVLYADNAVHLVYVGADNCPYCHSWEGWELKEYSNSPVAAKVYFTWIKAERFQDTGQDAYWPEHLRWLRDATKATSGTPRFVVLKGRNIKANKKGMGAWKRDVLPLLERLAHS